MKNRRSLLKALSLIPLSAPLVYFSSKSAQAGRGRGEWTVPDGVDTVRVKMIDQENNVVLSREVDVKPGYKFIVDVAG